MRDKDPSPDLSLEAEIAEGSEIRQALERQALKRIELEKAAESPYVSWRRWAAYVIILGGILLYFQDQLVDYIWLITFILFVQIKASSAAVHSRIDAILELERLSAGNEPPKRD